VVRDLNVFAVRIDAIDAVRLEAASFFHQFHRFAGEAQQGWWASFINRINAHVKHK